MTLVDATIAELQRRLQELETCLADVEVEREHDRLRHREHALGLIIENETLRDKNRLITKRLEKLRTRVEQDNRDATRREKKLTDALDSVHASRTWRAGQRLARPLSRLTGRPS